MNRAQPFPSRKSERMKKQKSESLVRTLAAVCDNPARLLELYYWSKEPGLMEITRGIASMSEEARAAIEAFIALAGDVKSAAVDLDARGVLTIACAGAAQSAALARHMAADETDDTARLLN